jgi:hypothetical protein
MQTFTRLLFICGVLLIVATAFYASTRGYGIASLNNKQIIDQTSKQPGNTGRSYFSGRTIRGGGPRYGK